MRPDKTRFEIIRPGNVVTHNTRAKYVVLTVDKGIARITPYSDYPGNPFFFIPAIAADPYQGFPYPRYGPVPVNQLKPVYVDGKNYTRLYVSRERCSVVPTQFNFTITRAEAARALREHRPKRERSHDKHRTSGR